MKLRKWVKVVIALLLIIMLVNYFRVTPEEKRAIDYCVNQGNPRQFCLNEFYGK